MNKLTTRNPKFTLALERMQAIHDKKNRDYCADGPYDNFLIVSRVTGLTVEQVFMMHIANKLARLSSLYGGNKEPNFESILDTWKDLAVYAAMGYSYQISDDEVNLH